MFIIIFVIPVVVLIFCMLYCLWLRWISNITLCFMHQLYCIADSWCWTLHVCCTLSGTPCRQVSAYTSLLVLLSKFENASFHERCLVQRAFCSSGLLQCCKYCFCLFFLLCVPFGVDNCCWIHWWLFWCRCCLVFACSACVVWILSGAHSHSRLLFNWVIFSCLHSVCLQNYPQANLWEMVFVTPSQQVKALRVLHRHVVMECKVGLLVNDDRNIGNLNSLT